MKKVKKIGEALHHSSGSRPLLICRVREYLERGTQVFNAKLEHIGDLKETFGPVEHPYAKVEVFEKFREYQGTLFIIN